MYIYIYIHRNVPNWNTNFRQRHFRCTLRSFKKSHFRAKGLKGSQESKKGKGSERPKGPKRAKGPKV